MHRATQIRGGRGPGPPTSLACCWVVTPALYLAIMPAETEEAMFNKRTPFRASPRVESSAANPCVHSPLFFSDCVRFRPQVPTESLGNEATVAGKVRVLGSDW